MRNELPRNLPSTARKHFFDTAYHRVKDDPGATVGDVTREAVKEYHKLYDDHSLEHQVRLVIGEAAKAFTSSQETTLKDVLDHSRRLARTYAVKRGTAKTLERLERDTPNAHLINLETQDFYDKVKAYIEKR